MLACEAYEQPLATFLRKQLAAIPGVTLYGPPESSPRTSTVSFTLDGFLAGEAAQALGDRGLFVWDGDFYAARLVQLLGLVDRGGLVRAGLAPYTTQGELERLVAAVGDLVALDAMTAGPATPAGAPGTSGSRCADSATSPRRTSRAPSRSACSASAASRAPSASCSPPRSACSRSGTACAC